MTNKEKLQEVLSKTFPKTTFILAFDELNQTEEIFFAEEWLKRPYEAINALQTEPYFWEKCPYYEPDIMFDGKEEYDWGKCTYKTEQRWIPVSERLPEDDEDVLIFTIDKSIYKASHTLKEWTEKQYEWFVIGTLGWSLTYKEDEVLAWMPLPEPFKAESEDKESVKG